MAEDESETLAGIRLTHPRKVLYAAQGITKRDLADYLLAAAERMLPHVAGRLLSLVRCPAGRARSCFFQRHGGAGLPDAFRRLTVSGKDGDAEEYLYIEGAAGLVAAAQAGVLELHIWGSRADRIERPDRLVFDLDPAPEIAFEAVKAAARDIRDALARLGLESFPLVTGGKGIHVVAPIRRDREWPAVKDFAKALAQRLADEDPARFVATMSKAKRRGRIFIDYLRNERGATAVAPFSPRAREGAPLAWPLSWRSLADVAAANAFRLGEADPSDADEWDGYGAVRQSLTASALKELGV